MTATNPNVQGEIIISKTSSPNTYAISCFLEKAGIVSCTVLDEKGVTILEKNSPHPKGKSQIVLKLPSLNPGNYNCWVDFDGKMHLLPIHIASKEKKGLLSSFMKHFS